MPRPPRVDDPGVHHVTARGNNRAPIFFADEDYELFLRLFALACRRYDWTPLLWCLIPNHVHLLLGLSDATLSRGMQWLAGLYAQTLNEQRGRSGHLFQGRFGSKPVVTEGHWNRALGYIYANPYEAGLCRPGEPYRWLGGTLARHLSF